MEGSVSEYKESPAGKVMSEAIELAIAEESPYPEQALFSIQAMRKLPTASG
jgi:hypothetical protein